MVKYTYNSWGKLISIDGTSKDSVGVKNPYRYRGYRYDNETKLYYLESRYYNHEICRFINADAIGTIAELDDELIDKNIFAYTGNNPINREDASGYAWETILDGASFVGSLGSFIKRPTWAKAAMVIWDGAALGVPFVPGSYVGRGDKALSRGKGTTNALDKKLDNVVYISKATNGVTQYVGITNNFARRSGEHLSKKGIKIEKLMRVLSRYDARAVEQTLIEIHGLSKNGGTLLNKINSISKKNPKYANAIKRGYKLPKSVGYK